MSGVYKKLRIIENPEAKQIGDNPEAFLKWLEGPSVIKLTGTDSSRIRAVCTLLHGNEPSGTQAVFRYLKSGEIPVVDCFFIIASVEAASKAPVFSNRMLANNRDLNRCFKAPFNDDQGLIAQEILDFIHEIKPECLVDIHNTSGSGPAFGVSIKDDADHAAITSLFTNDLIVTDLRLGALMELSESDVVTVTIECGGVKDYSSEIIASEGLNRFLSAEHVLAQADIEYLVNIFHNPIRLETKGEGKVSYQDEIDESAVITLPRQAEKFNYGTLTPEESIGFLSEGGLSLLTAKDQSGLEHIEEFFEERAGRLYAKHPMKIFMTTTSPFIARTDCLFYFISC